MARDPGSTARTSRDRDRAVAGRDARSTTYSHVRTVRRLNTGEPFVGRPTWVGILVAVLLAAVGTLMSVYLFRT